MKLTDVQRRILLAATLQANRPDTELARALGMREGVVRKTMAMLFERGIFLRRSVYVNPFVLGLSCHVILISVPLQSLRVRRQFIGLLISFEEIGAVVERSGESQIELRVYTRDLEHLQEFLERLAEKLPVPLHIESCLTVLEQEYSGITDPSIPRDAMPVLRCGPCPAGTAPKRIDERDHLLLSALANGTYQKLNEVARQLSLPISTLHFRISALEKAGIIVGHYHLIDPKVFQEIPIYLDVRSRALRDKEKQALKRFCRAHPRIAWMSFLFGRQSAEILISVPGYAEAHEIIVELSEHFAGVIDSIHISPQLAFPKWSRYPIRNYSTLTGERSA